MLNLVPNGFPGAGLRSGARGSGLRRFSLVFLALALTGCATKGDLRDVQDQLRSLAEQQRASLAELQSLNLAVQDTLRGQSDALFESRGDINRRLQGLEQELLTIQELLRMNQQSLATVRDLLDAQRMGARTPIRSDTEPGQIVDVEYDPGASGTGGRAQEMYDAAMTQFRRGSTTTARMAFQQLLQAYPNDPTYAPEGHYYLADIMVQEGKLEEAIQAFLRIPELFPESEKTPEALYRVGVLYVELDKLDDARVYLQRVVNSYPESGAATVARQKLSEIG